MERHAEIGRRRRERSHPLVGHIVVAEPAKNGDDLVQERLPSIDVAASAIDIPVRVVVAADRCTDATVRLVAGTPSRDVRPSGAEVATWTSVA